MSPDTIQNDGAGREDCRKRRPSTIAGSNPRRRQRPMAPYNRELPTRRPSRPACRGARTTKPPGPTFLSCDKQVESRAGRTAREKEPRRRAHKYKQHGADERSMIREKLFTRPTRPTRRLLECPGQPAARNVRHRSNPRRPSEWCCGEAPRHFNVEGVGNRRRNASHHRGHALDSRQSRSAAGLGARSGSVVAHSITRSGALGSSSHDSPGPWNSASNPRKRPAGVPLVSSLFRSRRSTVMAIAGQEPGLVCATSLEGRRDGIAPRRERAGPASSAARSRPCSPLFADVRQRHCPATSSDATPG
jgi:hypothetical protein